MFREMIQEYLVGLGVQIDKPGFNQMNQTLQTTEQMVSKVTGSWAANFVRAGGIIGGVIAGITAAGAGLMQSAAKQEIELEKLSRSMLMTKDDVLTLKSATDALGESLNDILLSPELTRRFRQLTAEGREMQVGGDFKETMQSVRDVLFEFTRLKQEAQYALTWIGYYLAKYLAKPLANLKESLGEINRAFIKNMSVWTEKIARGMYYIINAGLSVLKFIRDVGGAVKKMWDAFPRGVKIAIAALTAFSAVLSIGPLGRMIMLVSTLLLLIDDYYGYMEGKDAAFGDVWDRLNAGLETASEWAEIFNGKLYELVDWLGKAKGSAVEWFTALSRDESLLAFLASVTELWGAAKELTKSIWDFTKTALVQFYDGLTNDQSVIDWSGAIKEVVELLTTMTHWVSACTKRVSAFLKMLSNNRIVKMFFEGAGSAVRIFTSAVVEAVKNVRTLGRALFALMSGNPLKAAGLFNQALSGMVSGVGQGQNGRNSGEYSSNSIYNNPDLDVMGDVSTEGAQEQTIGMINYAGRLYKELFPDMGALWVSAVTNGGHAEGSGHYRGMKADVGGDAFEVGGDLGLTDEQAMRNRELFTRALIGAGVGANDEYTYPSAGSTGGHFDLDAEGTVWNDSEYQGEYGGFGTGGTASSCRSDPYITNGMASGFMNTSDGYQVAGLTPPASNVFNLDLGGIVVNGDVDNPQALSKSVANEVMSRLGQQAQYLLRNNTLAGSPTG